MKIKILSITLVVFLFNPQLFADIYEVNNNKIIILMESGVPLIDIRTKRGWYETGVIKKSNLLTFFDKDGNYDVKKWMSKLNYTRKTTYINLFSALYRTTTKFQPCRSPV